MCMSLYIASYLSALYLSLYLLDQIQNSPTYINKVKKTGYSKVNISA